ncbi:MAG: TM2 domain-containing protein [Chloroflexi bacterium]|nr:TM2 domain-containing protein [Chloroflexota bacterium]
MVQQGSKEWWGNLSTLLAFSVTLGLFGADRFYRGQVGRGVLKIITLGGVLVWWAVDASIGIYRFGQTGQWVRAVSIPQTQP